MEDMNRSLDDSPKASDSPLIPAEPLPPIASRFLFVDVAALRAKQLRRGAQRRFEADAGTPALIKAERAAMEEVRRGLVNYNVPDPRSWHGEGAVKDRHE
jgi:DNA-directed RNA polymerase subunit K/omega